MTKKSFNFDPLPSSAPVIDNIIIEENVRITFNVNGILNNTIKDFIYAEGMTQEDLIIAALEKFLEGRIIQPRPDKVKNKRKVGRKRKV